MLVIKHRGHITLDFKRNSPALEKGRKVTPTFYQCNIIVTCPVCASLQVTPKGREALGSLTAHRAGLAVTGGAPRVARLDREGGGFGGWAAETRCGRGDCQDQSDCEDGDDDPVPDQQDEDEDSEEEEEDFESFRQPRPGESILQLLDRLATRYVDPVLDELMNAPSDSD